MFTVYLHVKHQQEQVKKKFFQIRYFFLKNLTFRLLFFSVIFQNIHIRYKQGNRNPATVGDLCEEISRSIYINQQSTFLSAFLSTVPTEVQLIFLLFFFCSLFISNYYRYHTGANYPCPHSAGDKQTPLKKYQPWIIFCPSLSGKLQSWCQDGNERITLSLLGTMQGSDAKMKQQASGSASNRLLTRLRNSRIWTYVRLTK